MIANDLRYAARQMKRTPLLTVTVVLTLTLGMGIVTTAGSGVVAMLLRPLPFARDEASLVALFESQPQLGKTWKSISVPNVRDWQAENRVFDRIAPYASQNRDIGGRERPERIPGAAVSADFFRVLGVGPVIGRTFVAGEDVAGRDRVAVVSDRLWERRFHRDPGVLEQSIDVGGVAHRIVGVLGPHVEYPEWTEIWTPLVLDPNSPRDVRWLSAVARLAPGKTVAQAQADMDGVARRLEARFPDSNAGWGAFVRPLKESVLPRSAQMGIVAMLGADVLVLLLVCANVANLLLARASGRRQEMAMRAALGATRARLFRQVLVESLLYAVLGGAGGVLASTWGIDLMQAAVPFEIPRWIHMDLDGQVLAFAALAALGSGFVFGMAPAWHLSTSAVAIAQRADGSGPPPPRTRLRGAMLAGQFAISLVLLVSAVLMATSAVRAGSAKPGFEAERLLTLRASLHGVGYREPTRRATTIEAMIAQLRHAPGVSGAAATSRLPASRGGFDSALFEPEGRPAGDRFTVYGSLNATTAGYAAVLGLPLVRGRLLQPEEVQRAELVALVSQSLAGRLWPGADPLGRRFRKSGNDAEPWFKVVGVVGDVAQPYQMKGVDAWPDAQAYVPITTRPSASEEPTFVARTPGDPASVARDARAALQAAAPDVPVFDVATMPRVLRDVIWLPMFWSQMFGAVAVMALVIAAVGVYGYTAYTVASRTYEFGIRSALGARPRGIVWLILVRVVWLAAIGGALGLPLAWLLSGNLSAMLDNVSATDTTVYAGVTLFLLAVLLAAAYLPARRAAHADPCETLKAY